MLNDEDDDWVVVYLPNADKRKRPVPSHPLGALVELTRRSLLGPPISESAELACCWSAVVRLSPPSAGKPKKLRTEHLPRIPVPMLFFAVPCDPLRTLALLRQTLKQRVVPATRHVIPEGDHSLVVPKRTGRTQADIYEEILTASSTWLRANLQR